MSTLLASPNLPIAYGCAGLLAGTIISFLAPRLVAYRLKEKGPLPPGVVLLPLAGVLIARWRMAVSLTLQLGTALVLVALALRYGATIRLPLAASYSVLLIAIAHIDLDHRLVLNRLSYPGVVLALDGSILWPGIGLASGLAGAATGLAVFLAFQFLGRGAFGVGDMKLALLVGAMRGFPNVFNALLLGTMLGGLGALFVLLVLRQGRKSTLAYGPYLSAGAILSLLINAR